MNCENVACVNLSCVWRGSVFILSVILCWGQLILSFSDGSVFRLLFLPQEKLGIMPSELVSCAGVGV